VIEDAAIMNSRRHRPAEAAGGDRLRNVYGAALAPEGRGGVPRISSSEVSQPARDVSKSTSQPICRRISSDSYREVSHEFERRS